jgi:hypothetical protein
MLLNFFKRTNKQPRLVSVKLDGKQLCAIDRVPIEELPSARLESHNPVLTFTDSAGTSYVHDLTSVVQERGSWIHLSIRVHDSYACEADCFINRSSKIDDAAFGKGEIKGIRFQPFYLPECNASPAELIGKGMFFRGLHFPGTITPGNVSASCICDYCRKSFRLQSFHAGFGNSAYFYCSKGPHTLVIDSYIEGAPAALSHPDPIALAALESRLPVCQQCGGDFKYLNPLLCPHCLRPYIDFKNHPDIRDNEYYGNYLYGGTYQRWDEGQPAATAVSADAPPLAP